MRHPASLIYVFAFLCMSFAAYAQPFPAPTFTQPTFYYCDGDELVFELAGLPDPNTVGNADGSLFIQIEWQTGNTCLGSSVLTGSVTQTITATTATFSTSNFLNTGFNLDYLRIKVSFADPFGSEGGPWFINGQNGLQCSQIEVVPNPAGNISALTPTTICEGGIVEVTFTATAGNGPFNVTVNGKTFNGVASGAPLSLTEGVDFTGDADDIELTAITATHGGNHNCTVTGSPLSSLTGPTVNNIDPGSVSPDDPVLCADGSTTISSVNPALIDGPGVTYSWEWSLDMNFNSFTTIAADVAALPTGNLANNTNANVIYYFRRRATSVLNSVSCSEATAPIQVTVHPVPDAMASPSSETICDNTLPTVVINSTLAQRYLFTAMMTSGSAAGFSASGNHVIGDDLETSPIDNTSTIDAVVTYTVTPYSFGANGTDDNGSGDDCPGNPFDVLITVQPSPSGLSYAVNPAVYDDGVAISNNMPSVTAIPPLTYSVSPALPAGLSLDPSTGVISGTPTAAAWPADYTVTVTDLCGTISTVLNITVNPVPYTTGECVLLNETFDVNPILSASNVEGAWYPDRYRPHVFSSDGSRLRIGISASDGAQLRPGGFNSGFYNTQGRKINQCGKCVTVLKGDLYIPADWATKHRRSDMWASAFNASDAVSFYPIIGFGNVDGSSPTLRYWDGTTWVNLPNPIAYNAWTSFEAALVGTDLVYKVNGSTVATIPSGGSVYLGDVIMQAFNFNDNTLGASYDPSPDNNYSAYWDNIITTGTDGNIVTNMNTGETFCTIQSAIDAASTLAGHTLEVAEGTYAENVTVNKALTILGANAGMSCGSRGTESIIAPASGTPITVTADGVTINGFEINGPASASAIVCGNTSNLNIIYNNINNVGTTVTGQNVHAINYTVASGNTSDVTISDNCLDNIASTTLSGWSASAIGVLQSLSTGVLTGLDIERNTISDVSVNTGDWPTGKIAYGIILNVGASNYTSTTGKVVDAMISQNELSNLSGFISTAIGLEGNTENAVVQNNTISSLYGRKLANRAGGGYDLSGLKFESNKFAHTVTVENNSFQVNTFTHDAMSPNGLGYAVSNYVPAANSGVVDLECNWFSTAIANEIEDNNDLDGKIFNKDGCQTDFTLYLLGGGDGAGIGFQPTGVCGGSPVVISSALPDHIICGEANDDGSIEVTFSGGTAQYDIDWTGGSEDDISSPYTITDLMAGTYDITITDGNGSTATTSVTVEYLPVTNTNGPTYHATIQAAIDAATAGDVIEVCAGTYVENITVDKGVTINGPNATISPNGGMRDPEAIIVPASTNTASGVVVSITASDVSINGFTIDGDNTTLPPSGVGNGGSMDALRGIYALKNGLRDVTASKNIVKNLNGSGIRFESVTNFFATSAGAIFSYDNTIDDNLVDNITSLGADLRNSVYTKITNNTITNVRYGIFFSSFRVADQGLAANRVVSGNTIQTTQYGIWPNLYSATPYHVSDNDISAVADPDRTKWYGIMMATVSGAQNFTSQLNLPLVATPEYWTFSNNNIDGSAVNPGTTTYGFWLWSLDNFRDNNNIDHYTTITGGTIENVDVGILMHNVYDDPNFGIGRTGAHASLSNLSIEVNANGQGIYLKDNPAWATANISPLVAKRDVTLTIGSGVTITGGGKGLKIEHPFASVTGAALGSIAFNGQTENYIELVSNNANLDATSATFNGQTGATATITQNFAIENKVVHTLDNAALGLVTWKAGNDFVTTSTLGVQRGVDAASAGWTVNVDNGTFNENVLLNKAVTLRGQGPSNTILTPTVSCTGIGVNISSNDAKLQDIRVTDYTTGIAVSSADNEIDNVESVSNCNQGLELGTGTTDLMVLNSKLNDNTSSGFRKGTAAVVSGFTMDNCEVKGNNQGCFIAKNNGAGGTFDDVTITNSDFSDNKQKGMYFEALSNAMIDGILMNNSGTDAAYGFNNGIDINLKYAAYSNITIKNSEITNCGANGTATALDNPAAVAIKARDDGSYAGSPAILSGVTVENNIISGPVNGIRFGEFGTTNAGPAGVVVNDNHLGAVYSNLALINNTNANIDAECNWWGTTASGAIASKISGLGSGAVDYDPWLTSDGDGMGTGFQPTGMCDGEPVVITSAVGNPSLFCADGSIDVTFSGGTGPYTISWAGPTNGGPVAAVSVHNIPALPAGMYTVTVTDNNGSTATATATVEDLRVRNQAIPAHYATIQAAIDAASAGHTIEVCEGTYTENVTVNKQLTILGANEGVAAGVDGGTRVAESVVDGGFRVTAAAASSTIRGFTIQNGYPQPTLKFGVTVGANGVTIENNIIKDVAAPAQSDGFTTLTGVTGMILKNNLITNNWRGIYLNPGSGHTIMGNLITGNNGVGVAIASDGQSSLTITNNAITAHTLEGIGASAVGAAYNVNENIITMTTGTAIAHYGGSAINAECNWFGETDEAAILVLVSGNVDFTPWLTEDTEDEPMTPGFQPAGVCDGTPVVIASAVPEHILCGEASNSGSIQVMFSGGTSPYDIEWTGGGSAIGITSPHTIMNLTAGMYTITITDGNGSTATASATVQYLPVTNTSDMPNTYYATIQDAINAADPTETLEVCAGTHPVTSTITVDKALTINGPKLNIDPRTAAALRTPGSAAEAIIDGGGTVATIINITAAGVTLNGLEVRNGTGDLIASPGSSPVKTGVTVKYCIVNNSTTDEGIQLRNVDGGGVEYCLVFGVAGDGINLSDECTNSFIQHNEIYGSASDNAAIYLYDNGPFMLVDDNLLHNNTSDNGIMVGNKNGSNFNKNSAFPNNAIISNNTVTGHTGSEVGIYINTSRVNILDNEVTGWESSADAALYLRYNIKEITATGNTLTNNNRGIKVSSGVSATNALTFAIHQNTISGNNFGMSNSSAGEVNAQLNWWGDASGPSDAGPGTGNSVTANVNFCPWLDDVPPAGMPTSNTSVVQNTNSGEYFCSIQSAIDDAETLAGHIIEVGTGTYDEQVLVTKGVTIKGVGMTQPTVDFTGTVTGKPALFDVSADGVTIENMYFNVDLSKLKSAIIASSAGLDNITIKDNVIDAYGTPSSGTYGDRNAVSVNYGGNTNYRVAAGGVNSVTFTGNTVNGMEPDSYFRSGISLDEGGGTFTDNTLQTINHDILVRFANNGAVTISNNDFNGGGLELSDQNAAAGTLTVSENDFTGTGAPGTAVLRVKNNYNSIPHVLSDNTFTNYAWGVSLENMNSITLDANTFTTTVTDAHALVVNTKSLSSNSNSIVQVPIGATLTNNNFNGTGTALSFLNHDSDNDSYGTFTIGTAGNENNFAATLTAFIALDDETGPSNGTVFPNYDLLIGVGAGAITTKACWDQNINIQDNKFDVGAGLQLPVAMNFAQRTALEGALFHDPDASCTGLLTYFLPVHNLTQNTYHQTIQEGVNAATANDMLELAEWTFNERVTVTKSLTIQGVNKMNTIVDGTGLAGVGSGFYINNGVTDVTIKDLTVQDFAGSGPNSYAGIYAVGGNNNLTVQNTIIKDNLGGSGFYANGPIDNVLIDGNTVSGHTNVAGAARGIVIWNGLKSNITITNNEVYNNNCCGIELQDGTATGVTITDNDVHDNGDNGIGVEGMQGPGENTVSDNMVTDNGRFGIEIKNPNGSGANSGAGSILVDNNIVSLTAPIVDAKDIAGIAVMRRSVLAGNVDVPTGVYVSNNTVSGYEQPSTSDGFGIVIGGTNHTVTGNTVTGNDVGIQQQAGHLPYPGDGDQSNLADQYFGRDNSPATCGNDISGNTLSGNGTDERNVPSSLATIGSVKNTDTGVTFCTIQSAIDAASTLAGHTLEVAEGTYAENVTVNKALTILGANAGVSCGGSRGAESIIAPASGTPITVTADGVTINGFEINGPASPNAIVCGNTSNLNIIYNNINDIGTNFNGQNVHAINYTVASGNTSDVTISDNCLDNIASTTLSGWSASAIGVLQSPSTGVLTGLNIERNTINDVSVNTGDWPTGKIAYGIILNVGGSNDYTTTTGKVVDALIGQNEISGLSGFISTAIGLEGNTENAVVQNNLVSTLYGRKPSVDRAGGGYDLSALKFEKNRYAHTVTVEENSFHVNTFTHDVTPGLGYAVSNYVPVANSGIVELECNWFSTTSASAIEDNAMLTGKIFNKDMCQTDFVPYLTDGTDAQPATIGFQPVMGACTGTPVVITSAVPEHITCGEASSSGAINVSFSGGTANYTVSWTGGTPVTDITGSPYNITGLTAGPYTVTVTDANGSTATTMVEVQYLPVTNTADMPDTYYATIQDAIDAADPGDEIVLCAGDYVENVTVNKTVELRGPNYGISPNTGMRGAEATLYTSVSEADNIILIEADNVVIDGIRIDGDNTAISTGWVGTNGADLDVWDGITMADPGNVKYFNGLTVRNNIIRNVAYFGVDIFGWYNYNNPPTTGHLVADNLFEDFGTYAGDAAYWGGGVLIYNDNYTRIVDNVMTNVRIGIQTGNFHDSNPGGAAYQVIDNNEMSVRRRGIYYNLHTGGSVSALTLSNNTITAIDNANETVWDGILLSSLSDASGIASGNIINGMGTTKPSEGIEVWNVKDNAPAMISGGSVSNVDIGLFLNNYEGYNSNAGDGAHASVTNLSISPEAGGTGIRVLDSPSSTHAAVSLDINAGVTVTGGTRGLVVENANASINGGSLDNLTFTSTTGNYIELITNTGDLDGTTAVFDSETGATADLDENYAIENKIIHKVDNSGLGFVRVKAAEVFVTTNSGSVQRGVNAATAMDIVNVDDGTFAENVTIDKALTLKGENTGMSGCDARNTESIITPATPGTTAITVTADDVTIDGFKITNPNGRNAITNSSFDNLTVINNFITDIGTTVTSGNTHAVYISSNSGAVDGVNISNNRFYDIHGGENTPPAAPPNGNGSASAVFIGDSNSNNDVTNVTVEENCIELIRASIIPFASQNQGGKGAYGILFGVGATGSGVVQDPQVLNNSIKDLEGLWAHAIGLEGNTPDADVLNNEIDDVTDHKTPTDAVAVLIEDNAGAASVLINNNSFTNVNIGVWNKEAGTVDATCNWWDSVDPVVIGGKINGFVTAVPFTTDGTDDNPAAIGFQPVAGSCDGEFPVYNETQDIFFSSIQSAIDDTRTLDEDVIIVSAVTYSENVIVSKPLTLKGANFGTAGCEMRNSESIIEGGMGTAVTIASDGVTIDGFDITGLVGVESTGFSDAAIRNNKITANAAGINAAQVTATAMSTFKIENNCIDLTTQVAAGNPTIGVFINGASGTEAINMDDNTTTNGFYGYVLNGVNTDIPSVVSNGTITGVLQGVAVVNTIGGPLAPSNVIVSGMDMSAFSGNEPSLPDQNFHAGVYTFTAGPTLPATGINLEVNNCTIDGTQANSPSGAAVYLGDFSTDGTTVQTVLINGGTFSNNVNRGVDARGYVDATIQNVTFTDNGGAAWGAGGNDGFTIIAQKGATVTAIGNNITLPAMSTTDVVAFLTGNTPASTINASNNNILNGNPNGYGAINTSGNTLNATHNWWGDASGPSGAYVGTGASVSTNVDFCPWLDGSLPGGMPIDELALVDILVSETSGTTDDDGTICDGDAVTLGATTAGATAYVWTTTATTDEISVSPSATTLYTVSVTIPGCIIPHDQNITVDPLPTGTLTAVSPVCYGDVPQLTFTAGLGTGPFDLVINGVAYNGVSSGVPFPASAAITANTDYDLTSVSDAKTCNTTAVPVSSATVNLETTAPTWVTAANDLDVTIECSDALALAAAQALVPVANDDCPGVLTPVKTPGAFVPGMTCPQEGSYTNTWLVTDASGNVSAVFTQVITVTDNTAPDWTTSANDLDQTVECSDAATLAAAQALFPVAADLCDGDVSNIVKVSGAFVPGMDCPEEGTYTNTWTVTDDCGNVSAVFTQVITVTDNTAPTWTTAAGGLDQTVECSDAAALAAAQALIPIATDFCDGDVSNIDKVSGAFIPGMDCPEEGTYTNTWTVEDDCGNVSAVYTQVITVTDNTAPDWTTSANDLDQTVECSDAAALAAAQALFPVAADLCDGDVSNIVKMSGAFVPGMTCSQEGTYTNIWTVEDDCGNVSAVYTQVITVTDNTAPTWTTSANYLDQTVECSDAAGLAAAQALFPIASDLCDGDVANIAKESGSFVPGMTCPQEGTYTNTWTVTDDCGNVSAVFTQVITMTDNTAPVWTTAPGALDASVECSDAGGLAAAQALFPVATDLCDGDVTDIVKIAGALVPGACAQESSYTNTWTVTDDCGNVSAVYTQVITVTDNTAPTVNSTDSPNDPDIDNYACGSSYNFNTDPSQCAVGVTITIPTWTDLCDASVTRTRMTDNGTALSSFGDFVSGNFPGGTTIVTFKGTDDCGNVGSCEVTIHVEDNQIPAVVGCTPNQMDVTDPGVCNTIVTMPVPVFTDNCGFTSVTHEATGATVFSGSGLISSYVFNAGVTTIQYTATDGDGNSNTSCSFTVTVTDNQAPNITLCAPSLMVDANNAGCTALGVELGLPTYTDNCTPSVTNDAPSVFPLGNTIVTWTVADIYGPGMGTCMQTVTVESTATASITLDENSGLAADDGTICDGDMATLTANMGTSYLWSNMETTSEIMVGTAGSYTVEVTDANGCTAVSAPVDITVTPAITNNNIALDFSSPLCEDAVEALIIQDGAALAGGDGMFTYQWEYSVDGGMNWGNATGATATAAEYHVIDGAYMAGTYKFRRQVYSAGCDGGPSNEVEVEIEECGVLVELKVFLEGPYNTSNGRMNDNLRAAVPTSLIPTLEPYSASPYGSPNFVHVGGGGGETIHPSILLVNDINDAIVDWVFLELRDPMTPATVLYSRSALIQRDGDIVDVDGVSPVIFPNAPAGDYYVAVKHRNHLGIRTLSVLSLSTSSSTLHDFTTGLSQAYDDPIIFSNNAMQLVSGVYCMWRANANSDRFINAFDSFIVRFQSNPVQSNVYLREDVNLDSNVNSFDFFLTQFQSNPTKSAHIEN